MVSAEFQKVFDDVSALAHRTDEEKKKGSPSNDQQLDLYAWNKIARKADIETSKKPGFLDIQGKAMRRSWQKWLDEGITPEDAEKKYIELGKELVAKYGK